MKETVSNALKEEVEFISINLWKDSITILWWIRDQREWKPCMLKTEQTKFCRKLKSKTGDIVQVKKIQLIKDQEISEENILNVLAIK